MRNIFFIFSVFFLSTQATFACDCNTEVELSLEYHRTRSVFIGKVTKIEKSPSGQELIISIKISSGFKGVNSGTTVKVRTNSSEKACGYKFYIGQSYLIYANNHPRGGGLSTSVCSRTCHMKNAENDLIYITRETRSKMKPEWKDQFRD